MKTFNMKKSNYYEVLIWSFVIAIMLTMAIPSKAQQAAPYFCCDSITYNIDPSQGFNISLDTTGIIHNPDSIEVWWAVCTNGMCYSGDGMYDYFPQVMTTDTVHVCYDAYLYESNTVEVCTHCDYLIFNGTSWILFNMGNPTSINELTFNKVNDNKIYDLLGRELTKIPVGKLYIRNQKLYITR